jgi:hypothetical protein
LPGKLKGKEEFFGITKANSGSTGHMEMDDGGGRESLIKHFSLAHSLFTVVILRMTRYRYMPHK